MKQLFSDYLKSTAIFTLSLFILLLVATKSNAQWIELGSYNGSIIRSVTNSIATDAAGNVFAGGQYTDANRKYYIAKWNGMAWSELEDTSGSPFNNVIESIATDAAGNVYAGGSFTDANGKQYVAKWNGTAWSELEDTSGSPFSGEIFSIATDAAGNVYAGGQYTDASHNFYVAKWNGKAWSELSGVYGSPFGGIILSIATDAAGNVYAGGGFTNGSYKYYVAKWDGTSWSGLGGSNGSFNGLISSIVTDINGNVYAAGKFYDANNNFYVAKWNGATWNELGGTNTSPLYSGGLFYITSEIGGINSISTDANGNVYAGGTFADANGRQYVAKWNGTTWSELEGASGSFSDYIYSIATDTAGNVYTGGKFLDANYNWYIAEYTQTTSILPSHPSTDTANYAFTDSTGWTNYYAGSTLLLSLNTHGQNIGTLGDGTFAVKLAATAGAGSNTGIQITNPLITNASGYWVMNRYWQVTTTTEPTTTVDVRFYYNNQDLADVNGSYPNHNLTNGQLIFYKETGGNPDPTTNLTGATSLISILPATYASDTTWTYHQLTDSTQYAEFSVSGFSGGGGGGTGNDQALPIKIVAFTATKQGAQNLLQWTTAQETNSSYFVVEKSIDGANFTAIGKVSATGNSTVAKSYSLIDTKPVSGTNYYRLKIVDNDGSFTYSSIKTVNEAISFLASIYPNPVQNHLSLTFNSDRAKTVHVQIVSSEGKVMATQQIQVAAGTSTQNMNTASLSNGAYYIRCITKDGESKLKFVKD